MGDTLYLPFSTKLLTKPTWAKTLTNNLWALFQMILAMFSCLKYGTILRLVNDIGLSS